MDEWLEILGRCGGFQWDKGNLSKSWLKHEVSPAETEETFFNQPFVVAEDLDHSQKESRLYALGKTDAGRLLFVCFTMRENLIRVISARDMSRREREVYKEYEKKDHP
jgi:uncharacterized DUF497 family protein